MCVDEARRHRAAVGVSEDERAVVLALDEQLAAMDGSAMSATQRQEVRGLVAAALGAGLDVMDVDERRVGAARGATAALVAHEHGATQRRRDALFGARERPIIGAHVGVFRPLGGRRALVVAGVGGAGSTLYGANVGVVPSHWGTSATTRRSRIRVEPLGAQVIELSQFALGSGPHAACCLGIRLP